MMDQQRPFLYLSLFFLGFLIWSTWQEQHAPKPAAPVEQLNQTAQNQANSGNSMPSGSTVSNNTGTVPVNSVAVEQNVDAQQIHIKTDFLDMSSKGVTSGRALRLYSARMKSSCVIAETALPSIWTRPSSSSLQST